MDNVQKETHVVSVVTIQHKETCTIVRDEKDDRLLPHHKRNQILCRYKNCKTGHVDFGILPCVKTTSLRPDAYMKEHVSSDMLRLTRSSAKSQRKVVRKDQLHY